MTRTPKPERALALILGLSVSELRTLAVLLERHDPDVARLLGRALEDRLEGLEEPAP